MKKINFVMSFRSSNYFKQSKYLKSDMGFAITEENNKTGDRTLSRADGFALSYNHTYSAGLMKFGSMSNIDFYIDSGINSKDIAIYYELEEFVIQLDDSYIKANGIDSYIGKALKYVKTSYDERLGLNIKEETEELVVPEIENKYKGDPNKLLTNPGQARYEDVIAYVRNKSGLK